MMRGKFSSPRLKSKLPAERRDGSYHWPILWEDEASTSLPNRLALARVRRGRRLGLLTDAFALPSFAQRFVTAMIAAQEFPCADGIVRFRPTERGLETLHTVPDAEINWLAAELSNSSLTVGDNAMLKVFRRISGGVHPETEMGRHLTAQGFTHAPQLLGDVVRIAPDGTPFTLAVAFGFVRNEGDAWSWILDHLTRAIDAQTPSVPSEISDLLSDCEAVGAAIGRRLGEMHALLMQESTDPAFAPEVADSDDAENWARKLEQRIKLAFESVAKVQTWEREQDRECAEMLQSSAQQHSRCRAHAREFRRGHDHDPCAWRFSSWPGSGCRRRRLHHRFRR